ncbi:MAG: glycosyltransferase family 4 protein [Lachnospiraceae bacterium]|nr:glycosyltransferase family 4 protein [Lachnospiraceae bacterium]
MRLTFVSNYINHHQIPVSNELYRLLGDEYAFIQTEPIEEERLQMGWQDMSGSLPYLKLFYEKPEYCKKLILDSDVVVFGGTDEESYIQPRLAAEKLVLRCSERIYKSGQWKAVSPRGLKKKYEDHTRYRRAQVYLMCAGGYVASDFHLVHAYPDKMLKWGYFPETKHYDKEKLVTKHREGNVSLLWAGRFIDWKHPELPILLAEYLKEKGHAFHLSMVGGGEVEEEIRQMIAERKLEKEITLCGYLKPSQVREKMEDAEIYLLTSDYKEGWGAVLNEAMNSGCAVLASHAVGAVPYLLEHGKNGMVFQSGNVKDMCGKAELLLKSETKRKELGDAAYETIVQEWNAEKAADRLVEMAEKLLKMNEKNIVQNVKELAYEEGPLSMAEVIAPGKMYKHLTKRC